MKYDDINYGLKNLLRHLNAFSYYIEDVDKILNGEYDFILKTNLNYIKNDIESGIISKTDNLSELKELSTYRLFRLVDMVDNIIEKSKYLFDAIEEKKTNLTYNEDDFITTLSSAISSDFKYVDALRLIEKAKKISKDKRLYLIFDFYIKNESMIKELIERQENIALSDENIKAHDIISSEDNEIGIIVIDDSRDGRKIVAGTKKDIELSNLLGVPFPKDIDKPGYDYGDHKEFYSEPHRITKTFYNTDLSNTHLKMIEDEKIRRIKAKKYVNDNELGFIKGLVVTKSELAINGFDPYALGWKSLKFSKKKNSVFKLCKSEYRYCDLSYVIGRTIDISKHIMTSKKR